MKGNLLLLSIFICGSVFGTLSERNTTLTEIGKIRTISSKEIKDSSFSIGFECLDRKIFEPEKTYDKIAKTGVKYARCQTGWNRCETQKGVYDFKWLDDVVNNLLARGIKPWFNVGFGNPLYMDNLTNPTGVGHVPLYYGEEAKTAWCNFVTALSKHFKGRVEYYEIWNEPNIKNFWQPKNANATEYAKFVKLTKDRIKLGDPNAKCGACVSGIISDYTVYFFKSGGGSEIDFFSIHPYQIQPERDYAKIITSLKALIKSHTGRNIPIWQGESGYGSYFPPNHFLKTWHRGCQEHQAKWLLRRFTTDAYLKIPLTSFFQCVDLTQAYQTGVGKQNPSLHGIMENGTYKEKKSYYALANICSIFDSDTKSRQLFAAINLDSVYKRSQKHSRLRDISAIAYTFERKGYPLYAYYIPEDLQLDTPIINQASLLFVEDGILSTLKEPVLVDMFSGKVYSISKASQTRWAGTCRLVKNLPITDYPLILTDYQAVADRIVQN